MRNTLSAREGGATFGKLPGEFLADRFVIYRGIRKGDSEGIHYAREKTPNLRNLIVRHRVQKHVGLVPLFLKVRFHVCAPDAR